MKSHRLAFWIAATAGLAAWASAYASGPEALRAGAETDFSVLAAARKAILARQAPRPEPASQRSLLQPTKTYPVSPSALGGLLGSFRLAERLDIHRSLLTRRLGASDWDISMAADGKFETKYLSFARPGKLVLKRIDDLDRLRGEGIVVRVDDQTAYRFKVSINIFSPIRGSTLHIDPENGTQGPAHSLSTGALLDLIKGKSYVFNADGREYWLLYGTDVDPATDRLADTRSFAVVHEAGMDTKAWTVAESALTAGQPLGVDLGGTRVSFLKTADGGLELRSIDSK